MTLEPRGICQEIGANRARYHFSRIQQIRWRCNNYVVNFYSGMPGRENKFLALHAGSEAHKLFVFGIKKNTLRGQRTEQHTDSTLEFKLALRQPLLLRRVCVCVLD
jgi:hypothetical protein